MSDNQVGMICAAVVLVVMMALAAFRIWCDHKETMKDKTP
jgi:uncharacterized protein YsxB (DUF464 family)